MRASVQALTHAQGVVMQPLGLFVLSQLLQHECEVRFGKGHGFVVAGEEPFVHRQRLSMHGFGFLVAPHLLKE